MRRSHRRKNIAACLRVRGLATKVGLLSGAVNVRVRDTFEVRFLTEDKVKKVVVELVVEVDED